MTQLPAEPPAEPPAASPAASPPPAEPRRPTEAHGAIALQPGACTSCNLCVTDCPVWCIELSAHTERLSDGPRGRVVKVLDEFSIDFGLCMYCGICVEVCPFDALAWVPAPVSAVGNPASLVEGISELSARGPAE